MGLGGGWWSVDQRSKCDMLQMKDRFIRNNKENIDRELDNHSTYFIELAIGRDYPGHTFDGKKILDVGGGNTSLLLSCKNFKGGIVDPISEIDKETLSGSNIEIITTPYEEMTEIGWDEVWAINILRNVYNPVEAVNRILRAGKTIRVWEPIYEGMSCGNLQLLYRNEGKIVSIPWEKDCYAYTAVIRNLTQ
jgi:hypothetical protein